ncbi:MAG: acyl-CoA synthetase FdrA [Elusimicrobia bacterium]|nr:acyl-CoA synthetase FdrA [Elusimicrobiota bacterium]
MGFKKNIIRKNEYRDSVFLMQISADLEKAEGMLSASLMMGTPANKDILRHSGLLTEKGETAAENDLIIALEADSEKALDGVLNTIDSRFEPSLRDEGNAGFYPASIDSALGALDANFALISVPGEYAARETAIALDRGLNVMIFSDNVSIDDEVNLKNRARLKDLLLMGPDCGTAIINGVPLGFANRVQRGDIGLVAASGSGLQEVTVNICKQGCGITHAIGTGGRDISKQVGAATLMKGIDILDEDGNTKVMVILSKPPHPEVLKKILKRLENVSKPVVACFLGSREKKKMKGVVFTDTLEEAAVAASCLSRGEKIVLPEFTVNGIEDLILRTKEKTEKSGKYIRGLYAGGTLCDEAIDILRKYGIMAYSNAGSEEKYKLSDPDKSREHSLIDMGDDTYTRGKPHPMIDLTARNKRIALEAKQDQVGAILFDIVLGYGANADPAQAMRGTLESIKGEKIMIASVCGTNRDIQDYSKQVKTLEDCGVIVLPTNAQAARFAARIIK